MKYQGGMALIMSLVVIALLSTLGFGAAQQSRLAVLMSRNEMDLGIARMSAQHALSLQLAALNTLAVADFTLGGSGGFYRIESFGSPPLVAPAIYLASRGPADLLRWALRNSAAAACTIVELLRHRPEANYRAFRITARGVGSRANVTVLLQTYAVLQD
jgi:Tfp pilus assembly protein PilX